MDGDVEIVTNASGHGIVANMSWLKKHFHPFIVEEIKLFYDNYNIQVIYAHK